VEQILDEPHLQGLQLADPAFGGKLDILIGGLDHDNCVLGSRIKGSNSDVSIQPTLFGWAVTGPLDHSTKTTVFSVRTDDDPLHSDLARLWELDQVPNSNSAVTTDSENRAVSHFLETHSRTKDGRYQVKLPRVDHPPALGTSRHLALTRHFQTQKSLVRRGKDREFNAALAEYPGRVPRAGPCRRSSKVKPFCTPLLPSSPRSI